MLIVIRIMMFLMVWVVVRFRCMIRCWFMVCWRRWVERLWSIM